MKISVAALVATYRRPRELTRLLDSLAALGSDLAFVVVVDNGGSEDVRAAVASARCSAHYVNPGANLGCGGGLRLAGQRAQELAGPECTHYLVLDDDAVLRPDTLSLLAGAMESTGAGVAYPLVVDGRGIVGWTPGVIEKSRAIERTGEITPEQFYSRFGSAPMDLCWAQGICLLIRRSLVETVGWHRDDFWIRGEDLEFSLRLTSGARGIFVPAAVAEHLPPEGTSATSQEAEYLRHCALIQNIAYVGLRLPHGRRIAWSLAGALRRFFRMWSWRSIGDAVCALWRGAAQAQPAGHGAAESFRARCAALTNPR